MGLLNVILAQIHCHGKHGSLNKSKPQTTSIFKVPDGKGTLIHVCIQTFLFIFCISKNSVLSLTNKKKIGARVYVEKSGKFPEQMKFNVDDKQKVVDDINSIPRRESHYS